MLMIYTNLRQQGYLHRILNRTEDTYLTIPFNPFSADLHRDRAPRTAMLHVSFLQVTAPLQARQRISDVGPSLNSSNIVDRSQYTHRTTEKFKCTQVFAISYGGR